MLQPDDTMDSHSDHSNGSNASSKSSIYRTMVARTDSSEWRGSAGSRIEQSIDMADESLTSVNDHDNTCDNATDINNIQTEAGDVATNGDEETKSLGSSVRTVDTEEEPEMPVLYRDWEPKSEDCLEDVELADGAAIDYDAFENIKQAEATKRERRSNGAKCFCFILGLVFLILALIGLIIAFAEKGNNDDKNTTVNSIPGNGVLTAEENGVVSMTPLQYNEVRIDGDMVTVVFDENMELPVGYNIQRAVYDGPNCRSFHGGANDITGKDEFAIGELYSTHQPADDSTSQPVGFYLRWATDKVKQSPLYEQWGSVAETRNSQERPQGDTMDVCVGVGIVDAEGNEVAYGETLVMMTWTNDSLGSVRTVPLTKRITNG